MKNQFHTFSPAETEAVGENLAHKLKDRRGVVLAFVGGLGMGKTAFTRGLARGFGLNAEVSSPTFALVHEYGGNPPLYHFDMYRVNTWDDLYTTGYYEALDMGGILAVEWSENIEGALPDDTIYIEIERGVNDDERFITISDGEEK